jgi:predicted  nucleic acid-binding Zn-ribbon protein
MYIYICIYIYIFIGLQIKDIEREEALDRIAVLDRDIEGLNYEKYALEEEVTQVREELEVLTDKGEQDEELIEQLQGHKIEYESGVELVSLKEQV